MKISVIIPVKNRATLIGQTLDNLLSQSLKPHEIIIVDDNSNDNLEEVLESYGNLVTYIRSSGIGPGAARNTGLAIATGNAIQFFDSDDLITRNKLQVQANLLESKNLDFVYGPYVKAEEIENEWKQAGAVMQYYALPDQSLSDLVLQGWCLLTQSVLFRADFLRTFENWRTDLMPHEDWEYWSRIAKNNPKYYHENDSCVIYRQHGNQITDQDVQSIKRSFDRIRASEIISKNISPKNSFHSRLVFKGHQAYSITQLNLVLDKGERIGLDTSAKLAMYYFLIWSRIERLRSGTGWMRFHGANTSEHIFKEYIKQIN